eukprot:3934179-Alexandrium_andersonii.AAC.1
MPELPTLPGASLLMPATQYEPPAIRVPPSGIASLLRCLFAGLPTLPCASTGYRLGFDSFDLAVLSCLLYTSDAADDM